MRGLCYEGAGPALDLGRLKVLTLFHSRRDEMIKRRKPLAGAGLLLALSLAVSAAPAAAQRSDDVGMQNQNACQGDAQRLCNEFIPDRSKVASCLFKNKRQLSPACRTVIGGGSGKAASRKGHGRRHGRHHRRHR
jgi:hypothetical protein